MRSVAAPPATAKLTRFDFRDAVGWEWIMISLSELSVVDGVAGIGEAVAWRTNAEANNGYFSLIEMK